MQILSTWVRLSPVLLRCRRASGRAGCRRRLLALRCICGRGGADVDARRFCHHSDCCPGFCPGSRISDAASEASSDSGGALEMLCRTRVAFFGGPSASTGHSSKCDDALMQALWLLRKTCQRSYNLEASSRAAGG